MEILVLYFGIEKFLSTISPRMLISDTLKMLFYFVEFTYDLNYITTVQIKSFKNTVKAITMIIGLMTTQQLIRFGIMMGKFFAFDYYYKKQLTPCENLNQTINIDPFVCIFWYEKLLFGIFMNN